MKKNTINKTIKRALQTVITIGSHLGFPFKKYGYYIPYPYANELETPKGLYPLKHIFKMLENNLDTYKKLALEAANYNEVYKKWRKGTKYDDAAPRLNQDWFCGIDGAFTYALVRNVKPSKIIEVGSGFSTRFLARAIKDENLDTKLYSINPKKLYGSERLADKFFHCTLDKVPRTLLEDLKAGDILFIDASHLLMPGTDLELLFLDIIPSLPKGVYVHFHDILLPDAYPDDPDWNWWAFNEQHYLAVLLDGGKYTPVMPCAYIRKYHPEIIENLDVYLHPRGIESSFWFTVSK